MDALKELTSLVEQYEVLRTNIQMMKKEEEKELKSLVNIGSEVYMQARCPEKKYICQRWFGFSCSIYSG